MRLLLCDRNDGGGVGGYDDLGVEAGNEKNSEKVQSRL